MSADPSVFSINQEDRSSGKSEDEVEVLGLEERGEMLLIDFEGPRKKLWEMKRVRGGKIGDKKTYWKLKCGRDLESLVGNDFKAIKGN